MRKLTLALSLVALLGACKKTGDGAYEVNKPVVGTEKDTIHTPTVEMQKDTINTPVVGTTKDTLIVDRPTVGTKPTEVKVPVVKKP